MITIERKILNITIKTCFFVKEHLQNEPSVSIIGYSHSFMPLSSLSSYETLHIDLMKSEDELMMGMNQTTRRQIRRAEEKAFERVVIEKPTNNDLLKFQTFYNNFAKNKKTHSCNLYHMQTMKLLRDQNALLITYIKQDEEILCYRIYIIDDNVAMNLYSASLFRMAESAETKKMMGQANRLLTWKSILWFKNKGYDVYDFGGLTTDQNIRRFKFGFGGEIVPVYFGYQANSYAGSIILKIRDLKSVISSIRNINVWPILSITSFL
ncbi:hypothetical protein PGC35_15580 [Psychrobacillus sp. PGGUH221]|uniref:hypothetical protein n=1 Tax=Psychrobacillus sp. PGGUH221 TaxID=3020058 RepID=UPI0035C78A78